MLHRWFVANYFDPAAWFEARVAFTRTCAVWSVVGFMVGLGDRHTENLLLDG
jgi:serine/threonine-protein kinase ATR